MLGRAQEEDQPRDALAERQQRQPDRPAPPPGFGGQRRDPRQAQEGNHTGREPDRGVRDDEPLAQQHPGLFGEPGRTGRNERWSGCAVAAVARTSVSSAAPGAGRAIVAPGGSGGRIAVGSENSGMGTAQCGRFLNPSTPFPARLLHPAAGL